MVATTLTEEDWNEIIRDALRVTLQKSGMAANFPRSVFFGPELYQGYGNKHPFFHQEILHLITHLDEGVSRSQTGNLLQASAESIRLELGVPHGIGSLDYKLYCAYTSDCWYKTLWKFVYEQNMDIREDYHTLPPLREGDKFLMIMFTAGGYRGRDLEWLNVVRMSLEAITLADISTPDGQCLTFEAYNGVCSNGLRQKLGWPCKPPRLPDPFIRLWQEALRKVALCPYDPSASRRLEPGFCAPWKWYYSMAED